MSKNPADLERQRVSFGYRALGMLSGRVSTAAGREFDVPVIKTRRTHGALLFDDLPLGADFVEVRSGTEAEILAIWRFKDQHNVDLPGAEYTVKEKDVEAILHCPRPGRTEQGAAFPRQFHNANPIGSLVFLQKRHGPLVAFGPRLSPVG